MNSLPFHFFRGTSTRMYWPCLLVYWPLPWHEPVPWRLAGGDEIFRTAHLYSTRGLFFSALVLGGLVFLNTWDILPFTALFLGVFFVSFREHGWAWERLEEVLSWPFRWEF